MISSSAEEAPTTVTTYHVHPDKDHHGVSRPMSSSTAEQLAANDKHVAIQDSLWPGQTASDEQSWRHLPPGTNTRSDVIGMTLPAVSTYTRYARTSSAQMKARTSAYTLVTIHRQSKTILRRDTILNARPMFIHNKLASIARNQTKIKQQVKPSLKAKYCPRVSCGQKTHKHSCDLDL